MFFDIKQACFMKGKVMDSQSAIAIQEAVGPQWSTERPWELACSLAPVSVFLLPNGREFVHFEIALRIFSRQEHENCSWVDFL